MKPPQFSSSDSVKRVSDNSLKSLINTRHELVMLGEIIDWPSLEEYFIKYYADFGRPAKPIWPTVTERAKSEMHTLYP